jgi:hypothetical protein
MPSAQPWIDAGQKVKKIDCPEMGGDLRGYPIKTSFKAKWFG